MPIHATAVSPKIAADLRTDQRRASRRAIAHKTRNRILSCLLLPILLLTAGCSSLVTDSQVPGTYKADTSWGTSTLILSKEHTFEQTVRLKNGQIKHIDGKWEIDRSSGTPVFFTIQFSPYLTVTHDKQGDYVLSTMASIYHVPFGLNIAADPDFGIAHRKQ